MLLETIIFIAGLILLVKGSDFFVKSAATIAKRMGISEFIIGLTLVALGTSLPELASSIAAAIKHDSGLILGNIVGSNIANIGLIVGIGAVLMRKIKTKKKLLKRDLYIMLFLSLLFIVFISNLYLSRLEAVIFLMLYGAYLIYLMEVRPPESEKEPVMDFVKYFFKFQYLLTIRSRVMTNVRHLRNNVNNNKKKKKITQTQAKSIKEVFMASIVKDLLIICASGVAIFFGAKYVIEEAIFFATELGIPSALIGITAIAIGTSLPELSVTISAVKKKYGGMVVGNVIGSNIANIILILGVSGVISPLIVDKQILYVAAPIMMGISLLLYGAMKTKWELTRREGVILLTAYVASLALMFFFYM